MTIDEKRALARKRLRDRIGMPPEYTVGFDEEAMGQVVDAFSHAMIFGTSIMPCLGSEHLVFRKLPSFSYFIKRTS